MSGNCSETISTEPITAQKRKHFEIWKIESQKLQTLIIHSHSFQSQFLQKWIIVGERDEPSVNVGSPIMRDQIEIGESRLPF